MRGASGHSPTCFTSSGKSPSDANPPLETPDEEQAALLAATSAAPDGSPLDLFATLVRWPELMRRLTALGGYFFAQGARTGAQRELAILPIAALLDSEHVLARHRVLAADMGIDAREVIAARGARP